MGFPLAHTISLKSSQSTDTLKHELDSLSLVRPQPPGQHGVNLYFPLPAIFVLPEHQWLNRWLRLGLFCPERSITSHGTLQTKLRKSEAARWEG